jgi:hypothetical protein
MKKKRAGAAYTLSSSGILRNSPVNRGLSGKSGLGVLLHLAIGDGGGFQPRNLPCSGNGDAALAPKPAVCGALRGGSGTFLCMRGWLAELDPTDLLESQGETNPEPRPRRRACRSACSPERD